MTRKFVGKLNGWEINFNLESKKKHKKVTEKEINSSTTTSIIGYNLHYFLLSTFYFLLSTFYQ